MELTGEFTIPAPRLRVWLGLNDPALLRQCITGCESLEKLSDTEFAARVRAKIGPVSAAFAGAVTLSELDPPNSYRISGEGKGGIAGFAKGSAVVRLIEQAGVTTLTYVADAQVGGKLAQIGSRLVEASSRSIAQEFFTKFSALVTAPEAVEEIAAAPPATASDAASLIREEVAAGLLPPPPPNAILSSAEADEAGALDVLEAETRSLPPWIWITGLIVLLALIVWLSLGLPG